MKLFKFMAGILSSKSNNSSKRFTALWAMLLVSFVLGFAGYKSFDVSFWQAALITLLSFILALLGVTAWQATVDKKITTKANVTGGGSSPGGDEEEEPDT